MFSQMPPPLHSHSPYTIFISSESLFHSPSVEMDEEQFAGASQALFFSYVCLYLQFTHFPGNTEAGLHTNRLWTIPTTERGRTDDQSKAALGARRDGGIERMRNTGSRWCSPQRVLKSENLEFLISLLTSVALDRSIPMATALSMTL